MVIAVIRGELVHVDVLAIHLSGCTIIAGNNTQDLLPRIPASHAAIAVSLIRQSRNFIALPEAGLYEGQERARLSPSCRLLERCVHSVSLSALFARRVVIGRRAEVPV